jgi:hypothetical protein
VKPRSAGLGLLLVLSLVQAEPAQSQKRLVAPAIGAVLGTGAGGYVALSITALRARNGKYLFNMEDAFGWQSAAVLAGGGTGIILGFWDQNRLFNTVVSTAALGFVGTGIGAVVGHRLWPPPEGKWAGGVVGGGAGILLGAAIGVLMPRHFIIEEDVAEDGIPILIRIPVGG